MFQRLTAARAYGRLVGVVKTGGIPAMVARVVRKRSLSMIKPYAGDQPERSSGLIEGSCFPGLPVHVPFVRFSRCIWLVFCLAVKAIELLELGLFDTSVVFRIHTS